MYFDLRPFADRNGTLAGSLTGKKLFAELIQKTSDPAAPEVCFLDFDGIPVATMSFLRESVIAYRSHARSHLRNLYPVVANASDVIQEDLQEFLRLRNDAIVVCDLNKQGIPGNPRILGVVDGKQLLALLAVIEMGEAEAPRLAERSDEDISTTAWNNRLAALAAKGLLIELGSGKTKKYRPVLEGLSHGS